MELLSDPEETVIFVPSTGRVTTPVILASPVMSANLLVRAVEDAMNRALRR
jgi:hypothetical protein